MVLRKCEYCQSPLELIHSDENYEEYECSGVAWNVKHRIYRWRCGLCKKWGKSDIIQDEGSPTGHSHVGCFDRELLLFKCNCGSEELYPRGAGFGMMLKQSHEGHNFTITRTFDLGGSKITTVMGREIEIE